MSSASSSPGRARRVARAAQAAIHAAIGTGQVAYTRVEPVAQRLVWRVQATAADARDRWDLARDIWNDARMLDELGGTTPDETLANTSGVGHVVREGALVRIRRQVPANREAFQRWYADYEIARLLRHDQEPLNSIQSKVYFDSIILPLSARGLSFAIHDAETDAVIGMSALTDLDPAAGTSMFRIVIGEKQHWGRGLGTEATRLVMREAFERFNLAEVRLEVFRHNPRASAAYLRVGFEQTGEHVERVPRLNMQLHVVEMRLCRDEFYRREGERSITDRPHQESPDPMRTRAP